MCRIPFLFLTAGFAVLPHIQAAPAPKRTNAKPAVINAGTEKNVADVLHSLAAGRGVQLRALFHDERVAELEIVRQQKDRRAWLGKNLQVERVEGKNLIRVTMRAGTAKEQALIINAVVDKYLEEVSRPRASLTYCVRKYRDKINAHFAAGKLTQQQVAEGEESLKKREEYIRSLPALVEHAKAR